MRTITLNLSKELETKFASNLIKEEITDSEYILELIRKDLDQKLDLGEGFYYDKNSERFYNSKNEEIVMTKIEKRLLFALLEQSGEIVLVDFLMEKVWRKKDVSIFSFRNAIKKIRDKYYYGLIKNHSGLGYSINIPNTHVTTPF